MIPEWIIHRLGASDLRQLADAYLGLATYLNHKAEAAAAVEKISQARRAAVQTRRSDTLARDRDICQLYRDGLSDGEISAATGLSERQVRRITARYRKTASAGRKPAARGLAALGRGDQQNGSRHQAPEHPIVLAVAEDPEARQRHQAAAE